MASTDPGVTDLFVHGVDVVHEIAVLAIAFLVIRTGQALVEHYFPGSEPAAAARYIFGGP